VTKIDQQAELEIGRAKIIQKLSSMLIDERRDRFDLNDDPVVADEVD